MGVSQGLAAALVVGLSGLVAPQGRASAGAPGDAIEVTAEPSAGLVDFQIIQVTGVGFRPFSLQEIFECRADAVDESGCDPDNAYDEEADADGVVHFSFPVDARIFDETGREFDCRSTPNGCKIGIGRLGGFSQSGFVLLDFDPAAPLHAVPTAAVEPATGLRDPTDRHRPGREPRRAVRDLRLPVRSRPAPVGRQLQLRPGHPRRGWRRRPPHGRLPGGLHPAADRRWRTHRLHGLARCLRDRALPGLQRQPRPLRPNSHRVRRTRRTTPDHTADCTQSAAGATCHAGGSPPNLHRLTRQDELTQRSPPADFVSSSPRSTPSRISPPGLARFRRVQPTL